jgi:hypothetical protein
MRQAWTAKPRPQLKAVLQRLFVVVIVVVVGGVLHDDGVITFANFSPLLGFGFPFLRDLDSMRGGGCGSETNIFKSSCTAQDISATTPKQGLLD